jgi:hypothetical protein
VIGELTENVQSRQNVLFLSFSPSLRLQELHTVQHYHMNAIHGKYICINKEEENYQRLPGGDPPPHHSIESENWGAFTCRECVFLYSFLLPYSLLLCAYRKYTKVTINAEKTSSSSLPLFAR